ncbi:OmpA family protein [Streptomyces calvus]|nr:OmpA family protein [Streptomyces calvus]
MTTSPVRRLATALLLSTLMAGLLSACGLADSLDKAKCDWMSERADGTSPGPAGHTLILVDASASVRGTTHRSGGVDHSDAVGEKAADWLKDAGTVSVAAFGGDARDLRWSARNWSATPLADDEGGQERQRKSVPECVGRAVADAQKTVPARGGSEILGAMREASAALGSAEGPRRLIVLTDGLSTTGCADLTQARFADKAERDAIIDVCLDAREIAPDTLASVQTVLVGLGRTARDEPQAMPAHTEWLGELWKGICAAAHPQPDRDDCVLTDVTPTNSRGTEASTKRTSEPKVDFPQRVYRMAGLRALFDPGSAELRPAAIAQLTKIAVELRAEKGARFLVYGYVDPRGGSANNRSLSQARADAVRDELTGLGVRDVTALGKGVAVGCPGARGELTTKQKLQCDRRVDIRVVR